MKGFVYTAFGAVDIAGAAKGAADTATFLLQEDHDNQ